MTHLDLTPRLRLGISSCLLGERVRYDGGHKKHAYITGELTRYYELIPFCPEVAVGLGIPRAPIQLIDFNGRIRALRIKNPALDMTISLKEYVAEVEAELATLSGYIFKGKSPSCGLHDVKVLFNDQRIEASGQGIFAAELMRLFPKLPVIDEQQIMDQRLRKIFLDRVEAYQAGR